MLAAPLKSASRPRRTKGLQQPPITASVLNVVYPSIYPHYFVENYYYTIYGTFNLASFVSSDFALLAPTITQEFTHPRYSCQKS